MRARAARIVALAGTLSLAVGLTLPLAGCAHSPVRGASGEDHPGTSAAASRWKGRTTAPRAAPQALRPATVPATAGGANPSPAEVVRILERSGLVFDTVEAGRQWRVLFAGKRLPTVTVFVLYGGNFTVVLGKLFTVDPAAGVEFYRTLARKNFELDQLKLSVDTHGAVYASFEVPTRILDGRELLENVFGLATAIDEVGPELARFASPDDAPPASPLPPSLPAPTRDNPIIRAMRERVRALAAALPDGARG